MSARMVRFTKVKICGFADGGDLGSVWLPYGRQPMAIEELSLLGVVEVAYSANQFYVIRGTAVGVAQRLGLDVVEVEFKGPTP